MEGQYRVDVGGQRPPRMFKKPKQMYFEFHIGVRNYTLFAKFCDSRGYYFVYSDCWHNNEIGGFRPEYYLCSPHDAFIHWINSCYIRGGMRVWEDMHYYIRETE